ncbi:unnamed protein product [Moneuplotes crassus]|uniref:Uncharacterized protein n=1 Tax=Euplotes crassus TaxID=5936 RepID=A0AAD1XJS5_EUPCR|nr:unnamed protein product [Moneuplotes crassus]
MVKKEFRSLMQGEVLVKVLAATINPTDRLMAFGQVEAPGAEEHLPIGLGFEGSGIVEDGFRPEEKKHIGTPTAIFIDLSHPSEVAAWGQYVYMQTKDLIPFPVETDPETICAIVNPITNFPMMQKIHEGNHKAVVQSAACSSVGKILFKHCKKLGIPTVNIVRKKEQVKLMKDLGAKYVLNSTSKTFEEDLKDLSEELKATIFFDPIGGDFTLKVLKLLPANSTAVLMDNLSGGCFAFDPLELVFQNKTISSIFLEVWMKDQSPNKIEQIISEIGADLTSGGEIFGTNVYKSFPLSSLDEAIEASIKHSSKGKVIFKPHLIEEKPSKRNMWRLLCCLG